MKTLTTLLLALLFITACDTPKSQQETALESIERFLKTDLHDPESLTLQPESAIVRLDTIKNTELFSNWRDWQAMLVTYRAKNGFGAMVAEQRLFFLSAEGICGYSKPMDKLTTDERFWTMLLPSYKSDK